MNVGHRLRLLASALLLSILALSPLTTVARAADGDQAPGQVVVKLRAGEAVEGLESRHGLRALGRLPGQSTFVLALPAGRTVAAELQRLVADPAVAWAEPNHTFWTPEAQQVSISFSGQYAIPDEASGSSAAERYTGQWGAAKVGLGAAQARTRGGGATVAVLDTGVDRSHPALAGRLLPGWDVVDDDADPTDLPGGAASGHGTLVSGIVSLIAPDARILPVRVLAPDGAGTLFGLARGIVYAVDQGADVICLSVGANHDSATLREAVDYATGRGVLIVSAVGNRDGQNQSATILYPARYDAVLAVAATDEADVKADFSGWGPRTDIVAPGVRVYSTYLGGTYALWSGTSAAAAFVAGGAALLEAQNPAWDGQQVKSRLVETAASVESANEPRFANKLGRGRLDLDAATAQGR